MRPILVFKDSHYGRKSAACVLTAARIGANVNSLTTVVPERGRIAADVFVNSQGEEVQTEGWAVEESGDAYFLEPIQ